MAYPLILHVAFATQFLPAVAVFAVRGQQRQPLPYRRIVWWCGVLIVSDLADLLAAKLFGNNLWLAYFTQPVEVAVTLWMLAAWQPTEFLRLLYMTAIPVMGAVIASLLLLTDPAVSFHLWIGPSLSLLTLAAILYTLVNRAFLSRELLTQQDWFWICLGLALFWLTYVPVPPFAAALVATRVDWVVNAYVLKAVILILSFCLIAWGIICLRFPARLPGRF